MKGDKSYLFLMLISFLEFLYFVYLYSTDKSNFPLMLIFISGFITLYLNVKFQKSIKKDKEDVENAENVKVPET